MELGKQIQNKVIIMVAIICLKRRGKSKKAYVIQPLFHYSAFMLLYYLLHILSTTLTENLCTVCEAFTRLSQWVQMSESDLYCTH